ncbi:MAG: hypothetical protein GY702_16025, partial [Desulfobulbaceae bacterium]|nr:hypothetical protein [Desulfobulbaceae bacterium]
MKNTIFIQILIGCILLLYAAVGSAVTVDVNQDTISVGQSVSITATITVSGTAGPTPSATLTIDFGDNSSQNLSVSVEDNNTETFVVS